MKRKLALVTLAAMLLAAGAVLYAVQTPWAGERLCALASSRLRAAAGLEITAAACRIDPFRLQIQLGGLRVGPTAAPVFTAEAVRARLAPLQTPGRRLALSELELMRPRLTAALHTSPGAGTCPPPLLRQLEVGRLSVEDGALTLAWPDRSRVEVDHLDVRAETAVARHGLELLTAPRAPRAGLSLLARGVRLAGGDRRAAIAEARARADLTLDFSRLDLLVASAELPGLTVAAAGTFVDLCHPRLDLAASAVGEVPTLVALLGGAPAGMRGGAAADVAVTGTASAPRAAGLVRLTAVDLDGWRPGDASARLSFEGDALRVESLAIPATATTGGLAGRGTLRFGRELGLEAEAELSSFELGELLSRLQLPGAWVMGRLTGKVKAGGTVLPLRLAGMADLDLADFRVLDHGWERWRRGEGTVLDLPRVRAEGPVRVDDRAVRLDGVRLHGGRGVLTARGALHFDGARGFELQVDGQADLSTLRRLGGVELGGLARLTGVTVRAAPYGEPRVAGQVEVEELRFLTLDLGEARAAVEYAPSVLRFRDLAGRRGLTRYQADLAVDLRATPVTLVEGRWSVEGRLRDGLEAVMPWLPGAVRVRDALEAGVSLHGTAGGPVSALGATFEGELGRGQLLGRSFDGGRLAGRIEAGARAVFERAELRRAGGSAEAHGTVAFAAPFPWLLEGRFAGVALPDLQLPGPRVGGAVSGEARLAGSWERPSLRVAARSEAVEVEGVALGALSLAAQLEGPELELTAAGSGASLSGKALLAGHGPFEARATVNLPDVLRFAPGGRPAGLLARARGRGEVSGVLDDLARSRGTLRLDEASLAYGDFQVDQAAPVVLALEEGRVLVRSLDLRGANTRLSVTGALERSGALGLDARGAVDLRLVGGLFPFLQEPRGQLSLEAHLGGTAQEPRLVGSGRLREVSFLVRDLPLAVSGVAGQLTFSQNRVLFDHLEAKANGGAAVLSGELELRRLLPARLRVGAELEEVPLRVPEWLPSTVSGRLQAAGTFDAMVLSGKLHVVRALYAQPVDLERRLLEVPGKRPPPRPYDRSGEWVALDVGLLVDGDARVENDLVRGGVSGDLTLTGTLASVGLVGSLTLKEGARASFRGNELTLRHAVLDFVDRRRVRMSLDVDGEAQVNDYQVTLRLFGPWDDPTLQLSSQPALSQRDIVTLLSLGYTARDTAAAGGVGGVAAAAAAQALFSASGLDSQVRRFVPRNRILRDFTVRITSAYSEASGQVEPRAELESRLLDERFRLRYQAPLANARGQRAQAEMRLGAHTSLQYGWDNESPEVSSGGDHGLDLKLRWEWND